MRRKLIFLHSGLLLVVLALLVLVTPAFAEDNSNPRVLPPDSTAYGKTYGEWSVSWWQWALSIKVQDPAAPNGLYHPLFDTTGLQCGVGQTGNVWFLGGLFVEYIPPTPPPNQLEVTRTCKIPGGKALFFPVLNTEGSKLEGNGTTEQQLRDFSASIVPLTKNLQVTIDGQEVKNLQPQTTPYRVISPYLFGFNLPGDNLLNALGEGPFPAGSYPDAQAAGDGYYLMLAPLSEGKHVLRTFGYLHADPDFDFTLKVTYNLIVGGH